MPKLNSLICGDTIFEITQAYRRGAIDRRDGIRFGRNPFRSGSQRHYDWEAGYGNEDACEHIRFGVDVVTTKNIGSVFNEDPSVPRDEYGVDQQWYVDQLRLLVRAPMAA